MSNLFNNEETTVSEPTTEVVGEVAEVAKAVPESTPKAKKSKSKAKKAEKGEPAAVVEVVVETAAAVMEVPVEMVNDDRFATIVVDLRKITSNEAQSRGSACPEIEEQGFGIFELLPKQKNKDGTPKDGERTWWSLILSAVPEERAKALELAKPALTDVEGGGATLTSDLQHLKQALSGVGQLQNVGVNERADGTYDLEWGAQRCIALALLWAEAGATAVPTVRAVKTNDWPGELGADKEKFLRSQSENNARKKETAIDQARAFSRMKKKGIPLLKIAEITGEQYQTVRNRLQLLSLPQEVQDKIHEGRLPWTKALKDAAEAAAIPAGTPGAVPVESKGGRPAAPASPVKVATGSNLEGRRRMPTVKQAEQLYMLTERPADGKNPVTGEAFTDKEWELWGKKDVRDFVAFHCGIDGGVGKSRAELAREKSAAEKQALEAAKAKQAAEAAEKAGN